MGLQYHKGDQHGNRHSSKINGNGQGAGTINVTTAITNFTANGVANALIISDGATQGQLKTVCMIGGEGAGNSGSLTGANIEGTSIVFTANGHRADLVWTNSKWFFSGSAAYTP